ncbi:MAG TPA: M20/M25/M40 family metallo-hydrolase [Thermodesulfobacteriota bacterium]|nr:M20/M25/M40 family metallo-hydrolase [Thermodesulfobacteriota bacterium]
MEQLRSDLLDLVQIPGPSGYEGEVAKWISPKIQPYFSKVEIDGMGNLLAIKEGPPGAKVFVAMAHMDEVSMVVTYAGDGFIRFDYVGSINPAVVVGQPVRVLTQSGPIPGVVCSPSVHLGQRVGELWIDVGPRANRVEPGDPIIFDTTPRWLDDEKKVLATKAADDRTGCAILIDTARRLANMDFGITLIFAFTVQEEVGARGAQHVARQIHPTWAVAVDNAYAINPGAGPDKAFPLGTGPVIRRLESIKPGRGMYINFGDPELIKGLRAAGQAAKLPIHVDVRFNIFTDAAGAYEAFSDIKCTSLTVPRHYSHSPYEVTHLDGLKNTVTLLGTYLEMNWKR